jgi:AMP-binding enzyme C-terminal domain
MADNLSQLLATPLQPLREQWYSAAQAELLRAARARHEQSPDAYWTWVAEQQRSTLEIEAIATAHPQVAEAAVVGVTDATKGTVPVAFLTLLDGADPGRVRQDVSAEVASQLGGYARLGAVYLTSALPKTRTGKIMRRLLRDLVEHGGPHGDTSAMEDLAGLQAAQHAVQQAVAAEAVPGV